MGAGGQFANAFVTASAAISQGPSPLQWREARVNSLPEFASVNQAKNQASGLADGLYTVTGWLSALAGFSGCACIGSQPSCAGLGTRWDPFKLASLCR